MAALGDTGRAGATAGCSVPTGSAPAPTPSAAQVGWLASVCAVRTSYIDVMHDFSTIPPVGQTPEFPGLNVIWAGNMFWTTANRMRDLHTRLEALRPAPIAHGDDVVAGYLQAVDAEQSEMAAADEVHTRLGTRTPADGNRIEALYAVDSVNALNVKLPGPDLSTDPAFAQFYPLALSCHLPAPPAPR